MPCRTNRKGDGEGRREEPRDRKHHHGFLMTGQPNSLILGLAVFLSPFSQRPRPSTIMNVWAPPHHPVLLCLIQRSPWMLAAGTKGDTPWKNPSTSNPGGWHLADDAESTTPRRVLQVQQVRGGWGARRIVGSARPVLFGQQHPSLANPVVCVPAGGSSVSES